MTHQFFCLSSDSTIKHQIAACLYIHYINIHVHRPSLIKSIQQTNEHNYCDYLYLIQNIPAVKKCATLKKAIVKKDVKNPRWQPRNGCCLLHISLGFGTKSLLLKFLPYHSHFLAKSFHNGLLQSHTLFTAGIFLE